MYESMKRFLLSAFRNAVTLALLGVVLAVGARAVASSTDGTIFNAVFRPAADAFGVVLYDAAGAELGSAGNPLITSPAAAAPVQPVNDNNGSLTFDTPQLPAAPGPGGGLSVETCIPDYSVPVVQLLCASTGLTTTTLAAGYYRFDVVGGETARILYPAVDCATTPAAATSGGLVVGTQDPTYLPAETILCCFSATSQSRFEVKTCL